MLLQFLFAAKLLLLLRHERKVGRCEAQRVQCMFYACCARSCLHAPPLTTSLLFKGFKNQEPSLPPSFPSSSSSRRSNRTSQLLHPLVAFAESFLSFCLWGRRREWLLPPCRHATFCASKPTRRKTANLSPESFDFRPNIPTASFLTALSIGDRSERLDSRCRPVDSFLSALLRSCHGKTGSLRRH